MATSLTHLNPDMKAAPMPSPVAGSLSLPKLDGTGCQTVRVSKYDTWKQLEEQIPAWEAILRENTSLSIFSTPEWLGSWWKAFGAEKRVSALTFLNQDNSVLGLVPCYLEERKSPVLG